MLHKEYISFKFFIPLLEGFPFFIYTAELHPSPPLVQSLIFLWMLVLSRFAGGGKMCCQLWRYYSRVIPPLMRLADLMHCIECGGNGYFIWIFPFFFACTSLPSSSVFCLLVQLTCSTFPRNARFSGSSGSQPLRLSSLDPHPCVGLGLMCGWAFPPPQTGPKGSIPYSDLILLQ